MSEDSHNKPFKEKPQLRQSTVKAAMKKMDNTATGSWTPDKNPTSSTMKNSCHPNLKVLYFVGKQWKNKHIGTVTQAKVEIMYQPKHYIAESGYKSEGPHVCHLQSHLTGLEEKPF